AAPTAVYTLSLHDALPISTVVEIRFEAGIPVALNGEPMDPVPLVQRLSDLGGEHGIGRIDMVENRLVGIKSREIYESPAAVILRSEEHTSELQSRENLVCR